MLYPELFKQLEAVRWNMDSDIPWDKFDAGLLSDEQAQTIKMNAITEWSALRGLRIPGIRVMGRLVDISEAIVDWRRAASPDPD